MDTHRIAVNTRSLAGDLRAALRLARSLRLGGVELDARGGLDPGQLTQTGIRQIRKWLDDAGLRVSAVHFPTRGGYADVERLEARVAATKAALHLAHGLGAGLVLNHVGDIPADPADPRWPLLLDVLGDLGRHGQSAGALLCAEAGRAAPGDLVRLCAALPEGSLTCDLVTGSLLVHGHDPVAAVGQLGPHLAAVHATDAVAGSFAGRGRAARLGTGQVDLAGVWAALDERGYRGWITLEPVEDRTGPAEITAALADLAAL